MKRRALVVALVLGLVGTIAPATHAQTKLQFYYPVGVSGPLARIIDGYVQEWNQGHPQNQVEPVFAGSYTEAYSKTLAAIKGGTPPDVALMLSQNLNDILGQDIVIPLDELIAADAAQVNIDDFFPAFMLNSKQGGKVWSIPFQRSTPVMYYNKDALKEAGLDPAKPPQTQAELVATAKKLVKQEGGRVTRWGLTIPSAGGVDTWLFEALTIAAGGVLYDVNNACCKVLLSSPAAQAAVQFLRDLGEKEKVSPTGPIDWGTTPNDFVAGKTAMIYHSTGSLGFIRNNAKFEFGTAFLPKGQRFGTPTGGGNVYLFKATPPERRKAAWEFAKWLTSTDMLARWSIDSGYVAPRKSSWETARMKEYAAKYPQAVTAREQLQYALAELPVKNIIEVKRAIVTALQTALTSSQPIGPILAEGQARIDEILK
ncbi:MAG: ABC transporter substrate-binding protein [Candidatus Rokuibacteriota bacterium]|nr:MAG: ABC transporter substrate-binding protein [Candidatus Rokubacteria bacterium]